MNSPMNLTARLNGSAGAEAKPLAKREMICAGLVA